jgi:membrane-associated phospholipid phosphatase
VSPARAAPLDPAEHVLDYSLIGGAILTLGIVRGRTPGPALIGPRYDPKNPEAILADRYAGALGGELSTEKVTVNQLAVSLAVGWLGAAAIAATAVPGSESAFDLQSLHHGLVGYAEALLLTTAVTEASKATIGRLRPDFQARVLRKHCTAGASAPLPESRCEGIRSTNDAELVDDGRKSFFSGHTATAFATAGFLTLQLGGRMVWGDEATAETRWLGITGQVALLAGATWVAWGRVDDNRHHPLDVGIGAAVGLAFANLGYWRFFDLRGRARGGSAVGLSGGPEGVPGLGLSGSF